MPSTIRSLLKSVTDPIDPHQFKGVYEIPYSCGKTYIGETGRSFQQRIKDHKYDLRLNHFHTSTLVEHAHKVKHQLCLEYTNILDREDVRSLFYSHNTYTIIVCPIEFHYCYCCALTLVLLYYWCRLMFLYVELFPCQIFYW